MGGISQEVIDETRRFWEASTGEKLTDEDAREAIRNIIAFLDLLAEWEMKAAAEEAPPGQAPTE